MPEKAEPALSRHLLLLAGIAIVTYLVLRGCLYNTIYVWDDPRYIAENAIIKTLSFDNLKAIFSTEVIANYHPLTILSYALEYRIAGMDPWLYHFDNLLLHISVTVLVYWATFLLSGRTVAAVVTAILFAVHPMHVESVAWASGRKDLLYALFYMAACIAYIYYLRKSNAKSAGLYTLTLLFFLCAVLSKPVAVTLPLALFLIDYFCKRPLTKRVIIEKIPFLIISIIFGTIAIKIQHDTGAMKMLNIDFTFTEQLAIASSSLLTYLGKAIAPLNLHANYYYPAKVSGALPIYYYVYPVIVAGLMVLAWKTVKKNRVIVFGLLFFLVNISLVLQLIPVGDSVMAERYSYLPYLGLFFIAGWYVSQLFESDRLSKFRLPVSIFTGMYVIVLSYTSAAQCTVWYDNISLWSNEIRKEPERSIKGYNNLGFDYYIKWSGTINTILKERYYDSVSYCMKKVMELDPKMANPYVVLGQMESNAGNFNEAIATFRKGLLVDPLEPNLYTGLATLYYTRGDMDSCGYYFSTVLKVRPTSDAHGNYALFLGQQGQNDAAQNEFAAAISLNPSNPTHYLNRGKLFIKLEHWADAVRDIDKAIQLNPDFPEAYYQRSFCDTQQKNRNKAVQDIEKSISLGFRYVDKRYYRSLLK
jgi:protein O-mannosyl-transferase